MKKKKTMFSKSVIIVFVIISLLTSSLLLYFYRKHKIKEEILGNLYGTMLKDNVIYDIKTQEYTKIGNYYSFSKPQFNVDKKKILGIKDCSKIMEYDVERKSFKTLYNETTDRLINKAKYVPANNRVISMIIGNELYLLNLNNNEKELLLKVYHGFCWMDENTIIYSKGGKLRMKNIQTNEETILTKGYFPEISNDKKKIAFLTDRITYNRNDNNFAIYDIEKNEVIKEYYIHYILNYRFSPDDKYIAYIQLRGKNICFDKNSLIILDYSNDNKIVFIDQFSSIYDWK